jgi:serine/threonine protein kinase
MTLDTVTAAGLEALAPEFRVLRPLGDGAVAVVYLAQEVALERLVAVKVLKAVLTTDAVVRQRFLREARAAARIVHPAVVAMHRVLELPGGAPCLIMEYVEGRTLADVLEADGPLPPERAGRTLQQVASALDAAHGRGIIHRDVRPGNIMVENGTGRIVLTDFGLSGIKESGTELVTRLTRAGELLGDPRYTSPEQLLGEAVTEETDIYSFGVVGYEILAGTGPFAGSSPREMVAAQLQTAPRPLAELRGDVPPELARVIERCLARRPEHRPRAAELCRALDGLGAATNGARAAGDGIHLPAVGVSGVPDAPGASHPKHEPPFSPALSSFLGELKRRRVYRAAVTYLAVSFVMLQGADIVVPELPLPHWTLSAVVAATLAGLPVVLVLTWIFDLNRTGIERTPADTAALLPGERLARRIYMIAGILLSILVAAAVAWWILT